MRRPFGPDPVGRALEAAAAEIPEDRRLGREARLPLIDRHRQVGPAVLVEVADRAGGRVRGGELRSPRAVEPTGPSPEDAHGCGAASRRAGALAPKRPGLDEVGQDQVRQAVAVEVAHCHVARVEGGCPGHRGEGAPRRGARHQDRPGAADDEIRPSVAVGVARGERPRASRGGQRHGRCRQRARVTSRARPEDAHFVAPGQDREVARAVAVEVGGRDVGRPGYPDVAMPAQDEPVGSAPEHPDDRAGGLPGEPRLAVERDDVGPAVPVEIGRHHRASVVDRQRARVAARAPPVVAPPEDGQKPARVLQPAVVRAEDRVRVAVPVEVVDDDARAPLDGERLRGEHPPRAGGSRHRGEVARPIVRAVEDQIEVAVLVEVEAVDGPYRAVARYVEVRSGGVAPAFGEVFEGVIHPARPPRALRPGAPARERQPGHRHDDTAVRHP